MNGNDRERTSTDIPAGNPTLACGATDPAPFRSKRRLLGRLGAATLGGLAIGAASLRLAAAVFDVGPGQPLTNLAAVSWPSLNPGDTVNIHYKTGGYHEIILLSSSGVAGSPITINGVPDPSTGALPVLDGQNAITAAATPWHDPALNTEGVVIVSPASTQPAGSIPSWIVIQNLHIQNATTASSLTESGGATAAFDGGAAALYVEFARHLIVRGCELNNSCNGFFCGAQNGDVNRTSADTLVERCWVHDNGLPGNYEAHNLSTESKGIVFQYNRVGPLLPGAAGVDIKDRSSGTILRYNEIIQSTDGAALWLVQPQGGLGVIDTDPAYHTNFVYGNLFLNTTNSTALGLFVYDSDAIQGQPRNATLYFYNNTVVNYGDQSQRYYTQVFQFPTHDEVTTWNVHDVLDCRNNLFASIPATPGGTPSNLELVGGDDGAFNFGVNWASPNTVALTLPYGVTNFYGTMTGTNLLVLGDGGGLNNPGFINPPAGNFHLLSSSPAIDGSGPQSPLVLASPNNVVEEYLDPAGETPRLVNGLGLDLGAFEGTSTKGNGLLYSVTVNAGFGSGSFPVGAVVPVVAQPAPAGEAFAGWTGYAVQDAASVGTTCIMPATNVTLTATYTNLPIPVDFTLTVVNGSGGGLFPPGSMRTITAAAAPSGETFIGWTGFPVADSNAATTTLTMPTNDVTVIANYQASSTFNLTVINGSGGGVYAPGATVTITANTTPAGDYFAGWTGYTVTDPDAATPTLPPRRSRCRRTTSPWPPASNPRTRRPPPSRTRSPATPGFGSPPTTCPASAVGPTTATPSTWQSATSSPTAW